ncbi:hypothetical protein FQA39_LY07661 [Lamprigera yunnana]|nr:hypothetical protein FQA39_LY07661 [Lamprigera yunnana]
MEIFLIFRHIWRVVKPEEPQESFDFTGRRIVDIQYLFKSLQSLKHEGFNCTFSDVEITNEKRICFGSIFTSKCKMCNKVDLLSTEDSAKEQLDVTTAAVSEPRKSVTAANNNEDSSDSDVPTCNLTNDDSDDNHTKAAVEETQE